MNTKEYLIVEGLNSLDDVIGKHLDQTKSAMRVFSDDAELLQQYKQEYANRLELRNFIRDLVEEFQQSGYAITDSKSPDNARLLATMEGF